MKKRISILLLAATTFLACTVMSKELSPERKALFDCWEELFDFEPHKMESGFHSVRNSKTLLSIKTIKDLENIITSRINDINKEITFHSFIITVKEKDEVFCADHTLVIVSSIVSRSKPYGGSERSEMLFQITSEGELKDIHIGISRHWSSNEEDEDFSSDLSSEIKKCIEQVGGYNSGKRSPTLNQQDIFNPKPTWRL